MSATRFLSSRDGELEALWSEVGTLKARLTKMASTRRTEFAARKDSNEATSKN